MTKSIQAKHRLLDKLTILPFLGDTEGFTNRCNICIIIHALIAAEPDPTKRVSLFSYA
jgi:hypothetical protein